MPLHKIEWTGTQSGWALWHITETERELADRVHPETSPVELASTAKRLEWLAARILLKTLMGRADLPYQPPGKDEYGKPFLPDFPHSISLSHSYPYVAAQIDLHATVGIDVEQPKEKLLRIAPRIFDPVEAKDAGQDITKNCVYWCAKEALYKIYGKRGLTFSKHLNLQPFSLSSQGSLKGKITANGQERLITLGYWVEKDFVLVYTKAN